MGDNRDTEIELLELEAERKAMTQPELHSVVKNNEHVHGTFGNDSFGRIAERVAKFMGTPKFIIIQTLVVLLWVALNVTAVVHHWDPYPFILLNLAFSTQSAYAAPMILLAQTRQAGRDKATADGDAKHREEIASKQAAMLESNTTITQTVLELQQEQMTQLLLLQSISAKLGCNPPKEN